MNARGTHFAANGFTPIWVPVAGAVNAVLPQTLRSALGDPDDRSEIEARNDARA